MSSKALSQTDFAIHFPVSKSNVTFSTRFLMLRYYLEFCIAFSILHYLIWLTPTYITVDTSCLDNFFICYV